MDNPLSNPRMAMIGRPGIGGEFLDVYATGYGRYGFRRWRRINSVNDVPRQLKVDDLPAEAVVYDLVSVIERIADHMNNTTDWGLKLDDRGLSGDRPTLRERLQALADFETGPGLPDVRPKTSVGDDGKEG